ncbi:putative cyclic nucleotide-gated ion channel 20, chloroplastic [Tasmannia lanceolata]|uniref:putative cyclic nucleotide-gated ion channel 20, chloroplastic n=1 Tax=Tasmannia lanceolata TaxID=3420 RepID=UPI0040631B56
MAGSYNDEVPMLADAHSQLSEGGMGVEVRRFPTRSVSMSISMNARGAYESETSLVSHTGPLLSERKTPYIPMSGPLFSNRKSENLFQPMHGLLGNKKGSVMAEEFSSVNGTGQDMPYDNLVGKNEHLLKSGPLGRCNDPYCTTCPTYYNFKPGQQKKSKSSAAFENKFHNALYGDGRGWVRRSFSFLDPYLPGIMNPHAKVVQRWNRFFVISCFVAIFIDPLFFFLLSAQQDNLCLVLNWPLATAIAIVRSVTDFIYLLHMLLQFRLAYVAPESRVVGSGDLVDQPKKIALHYLRGYFLLDLFIVLPVPQIMILLVLPKYLGSSEANYFKNLLRAAVLLQYIPRMFRFVPLVAGQSASGFIFESAWANFVINLLTFILAGHVVGSCWYLFGLQRLNQCLRDACRDSGIPQCKKFIDCGRGNNIEGFSSNPDWQNWLNNTNAIACFNTTDGPFSYGIYYLAVNISTEHSIVSRYIYSLFWGFLQISTLAGNQVPSSFVWEVLFTMGIIGLGLFLFALLIGNMQNFLQSLGRRRLEMQLRIRDVEQWMSHRRMPDELRRQVRQLERFNWAATRGVNEEELLENLPEDLQREIRRHLFKFVKKVRIFTLMDEPILDAICERLRQKLYIGGSKILYQGGHIDKMVFIVRGKMESDGGDGNIAPLSDGDVCGEELLTWCLDHSSVSEDGRKIRLPGQRLVSNRTVRCVTNVEAFILRAADLEAVTSIFARFLRNPRVQGAIRYESPYWRAMAATRIQVAWRYRQKCLNRTETPNRQPNYLFKWS